MDMLIAVQGQFKVAHSLLTWGATVMIYVINKLSDLVTAKSCKNNIEKRH